jgi:hypothetical protein
MKIGEDYFKTCQNDIGDFVISIKEESNWSLDGGYTFEDITNSVDLNLDQCKELSDALLAHIEELK